MAENLLTSLRIARPTRRIAFTLAKMSSKLGLPHPSSADLLLQAAMERTEAVTPEEFKVAYAMRSRGNLSDGLGRRRDRLQSSLSTIQTLEWCSGLWTADLPSSTRSRRPVSHNRGVAVPRCEAVATQAFNVNGDDDGREPRIARAYRAFVLDRASRRVTKRAPLQSSTAASSTNCLAHTIASSSLSQTKPRCRLNLPS